MLTSAYGSGEQGLFFLLVILEMALCALQNLTKQRCPQVLHGHKIFTRHLR